MGIDLPAPAKHIRLTSHHPIDGATGAPPIRWGAADPLARGPIVGTTTDRSRRNVIGTHSGIYGVYSYREVFEFKEFWSIGSGRSFALGAMHAAYGKARNAREVAKAGIDAACEFDRNSAGPVDVFTLKLKV